MNYIVLDTETTNSLEEPLTYDIGWVVVNKGKDLNRSYVVKEIFESDELMSSDFYKDKIPAYKLDIKEGRRIVLPLIEIKRQLEKDCLYYEVEAIVAHNMRFDYNALQGTIRYLTKSKYRYFLPFGVELWDSLKMSREAFSENADYIGWCTKNGFIIKGKPRFTAEVLYKYLKKNDDFIESHTGLEDAQIEKDIFFECLKKNVKNRSLFEKRFIEVFNGRTVYYVECRPQVIGGKYLKEEDIPDGVYVVFNNGDFYKKELEIF